MSGAAPPAASHAAADPIASLTFAEPAKYATRTGLIKNSFKRSAVANARKMAANTEKKTARLKRKAEAQALGVALPEPKTIDTKRVRLTEDSQPVQVDDTEVQDDDAQDEFAEFWAGRKDAKILLTTRPRPTKHLFRFAGDLMAMIPRVFFHPRKSRELKEMAEWGAENDFTHMIVLGEKAKMCNRLTVSVLPEGPTAQFKVSNVVLSKEIRGHGNPTDHLPEILLNNFSTRLGHRMGRLLGSLFPHRPEFEGRTVVTFHNQRDFVFLRHHRYAFKDGFRGTDLQELGPRCTLKLRYLCTGSIHAKHSEYEYLREKAEQKVKRVGDGGREFTL